MRFSSPHSVAAALRRCSFPSSSYPGLHAAALLHLLLIPALRRRSVLLPRVKSLPVKAKHPRHRLPRPCYLGLRSYFLTVCASQRRKLFTDARLVELLISELGQQFRSHGFSIYAYCFMPDHCHVLTVALTETSDVARAVRAFKGASAARARSLGIRNLWQRDYYDHILRSSESFDAAAAYIFENPVRARLVFHPHDWPFSGSFVLEWKNLGHSAVAFVPPWKKSV
jgi:putative transposase